ncbi:MAG TPA: UDP-N-acetylmuramate dehydrogenase [Candidatus Vogelbacteria bacterium]|nr:UDP-N-acetylmuramate dehydrogenase [Candidatus Vogelbacteria bacterium]
MKKTLEKYFSGMKLDYNIVPQTTFGLGGYIRYYLPVKTTEDFVNAIKKTQKHKIPFRVLAGGSNVIFPENFDKLLIHFLPSNDELKTIIENNSILTEANVSLNKLVEISVAKGLEGLESLIDIPGTIGGGIVGNAGAYGQSISDCIDWVEVFDGEGIKKMSNEECLFDYRDSIFKKKNLFVIRAGFKFEKGDKEIIKKRAEDIKIARRLKYKKGLRCPGSFFKNVLIDNISQESLKLIDKDKIINNRLPAGYLLEESGAKGRSCGDIFVSDFHSNVLINKGQGTYTQVKTLAEELKRAVENKFGILLEEEVRYML